MARSMNKRNLAKGIDFYSIAGVTHAVRINIHAAKPFTVGSIIGKVETKGTVDNLSKLKLKSNIVPKLKDNAYDFKVGKSSLVPLWISNGIFFGDDCYEFSEKKTPLIARSIVAGNIVHRGQAKASASPTISKAKRKRWGFFQSIGSGSSGPPGSTIELKRETALHNANYYADPDDEEWYSVMTGAGCLIENGTAHTRGNAHRTSGGSFQSKDGDPTYCAGPVIALNKDLDILYIIQDLTDRNGQSGTNEGRDWGQMAKYLKGDSTEGNFLEDIKCKDKDESIRAAIVFDGGSSRSLWVRGKGIIGGYENDRPVPHYICLWGHG